MPPPELPGRIPRSADRTTFRYPAHYSRCWEDGPGGGFWCDGEGEYDLVQYRLGNGAARVRHRCLVCGRMMTFDLPYRDEEAREFPLYRDRIEKNPPCARCGRFGTEYHHWAPQAVFLDADSWPTSWLCRDCHTHWHQIMRIAGAPHRTGEP